MDENMNDDRETTHLSKNLMQMKFMQRSVFRLEREQQEEEGRVIDDEHWVLDLPELQQRESKYLTEPSLAVCATLRFGRISAGGMNPVIEKLMRMMDGETEAQASAEREEANIVTDNEMALRYQSLVGTISNKFKTKRQRRVQGEEGDEQGEEGYGQGEEGYGQVEEGSMKEDIASFLRQQRAEVEEGQEGHAVKKRKTGHKGHFLKPSDL